MQDAAHTAGRVAHQAFKLNKCKSKTHNEKWFLIICCLSLSLGRVLGVGLGLGVLQLVQLANECVQSFREHVKTSNLDKRQDTMFCV